MVNKEEAKKELQKLVEIYHKYKDDDEFANNEAQLCDSLIKPFFSKVLGWDTNYPNFIKEAKKSGKRIDYLVKIDRISQFVIEAKSLNHDIRDDVNDYKQAISYGHSKEKNYAILTNFKHFIILNCSVNVNNPLQAQVNHIVDLTDISDEQFNLIWNFSYNVWFEKGENNEELRLKTTFKRRKKVDELLLEDMKKWRLVILTNLRKHPKLNNYQWEDEKVINSIEEEIQRFIDRLIFVCYCEDKELSEKELRSLIDEKDGKYWGNQHYLLEKIRALFKTYWETYDSDLFRVGECDKFYIEDGIILQLLKDLRRPKEGLSYDFANIELDILGRTYENFIGHVLSGKKRFKEKESKGKRKEGGIYYTPQYIVNFIVENTVRKYLKGKSFNEIKKVKILDPACGSGSFLLGVFDVLIEESYRSLRRDLSYDEKSELLISCIFGVDKDERACDIAKLNLSLKLAEKDKKLPELHNNIKNGDSLIDDRTVVDYKAFKWRNEFKEIMDGGGFDIIVGNPPYIRNTELPIKDKEFFTEKYSSTHKQYDIYILFFEQSIKLLKDRGYLGFITSNKFLVSDYGMKIRELMLDKCKIIQILDVSNISIFKDAMTYPAITILQDCQNLKEIHRNDIEFTSANNEKDFPKVRVVNKIKQNEIIASQNKELNQRLGSQEATIIKIIDEKSIKLGDLFYCKRGSPKNKIKQIFDDVNSGIKSIQSKDVQSFYPAKVKISVKSNLQDEIINTKKILLPRTVLSIRAAVGEKGHFIMDRIYYLIPKKEGDNFTITLALLNSKLVDFYYKFKYESTHVGGGYLDLRGVHIKEIPIIKSELISTTLRDKMEAIINDLIDIRKRMDRTTHSDTGFNKLKTLFKEKIQQLNDVIYLAYGINKDSIKVMEGFIK